MRQDDGVMVSKERAHARRMMDAELPDGSRVVGYERQADTWVCIVLKGDTVRFIRPKDLPVAK